MKKTIGICLFTVVLTACVFGSLAILNTLTERRQNEPELADATEIGTETEMPELAESMQVQKTYRYLLVEEDGVLIVYEKDGKTILLETNIRVHGLDEETQKLLHEGIWITDEEELYDFLESYSS